MARSRRPKRRTHKKMPSVTDTDEEPTTEGPIMSEEEVEGDFEADKDGSPDHRSINRHSGVMALPPLPELDASDSSEARSHPARSGSMGTVTTVKIERRARLAEKLRDVFDLKGIQEVVSGWSHEFTFRRYN